jgi:hypothetical protein
MKADLSLISEAKRVAEDVRARSGTQGIDYLVLSQGASKLPYVLINGRLSAS